MSNTVYGYSSTYRVKDRNGLRTLTVTGCTSREDAKRKVVEIMVAEGWKPRRWWEFWRWDETGTKT
jgi:hypothetical protein